MLKFCFLDPTPCPSQGLNGTLDRLELRPLGLQSPLKGLDYLCQVFHLISGYRTVMLLSSQVMLAVCIK